MARSRFSIDVVASVPIVSIRHTIGKLPKRLSPTVGFLPTEGDQVSLPQRGLDICKPRYSRKRLPKNFHEIKDEKFWQILPEVHDFTQLPVEPMWSLYEAVRYIVTKDIKGDMVECGVFFGGASMLIAKTLLSLGDTSRAL